MVFHQNFTHTYFLECFGRHHGLTNTYTKVLSWKFCHFPKWKHLLGTIKFKSARFQSVLSAGLGQGLGNRWVKSWNNLSFRSPRRYGFDVGVWRWQPGGLNFGRTTTPSAPFPGEICERNWWTGIKENGEEYWQTDNMGCADVVSFPGRW